MSNTKISWTEKTWNPLTGCTKISEGCQHCYAETMSKRLMAMAQPKYKSGFDLALHSKCLSEPYGWKKPYLVFVNSMSDLFHKDVPLTFIKEVFAVMNNTPKHTYQVLTKRSDILEAFAPELTWSDNIWMGVTVENDRHLNRIGHLQNTGAAVKFLSLEPLLSALPDLDKNIQGIDWVIVGGESGAQARPMQNEWVQNIRDVCQEMAIAFFFKQWSGFHPKKLGSLVDGKEYRQFPLMPTIQTATAL